MVAVWLLLDYPWGLLAFMAIAISHLLIRGSQGKLIDRNKRTI